MNTVQHNRKIVTRHEIHMEGPINARDLSDFVHQVDNIYVQTTGKAQISDDAYYVTGDEDGLTATFETKETA